MNCSQLLRQRSFVVPFWEDKGRFQLDNVIFYPIKDDPANPIPAPKIMANTNIGISAFLSF